METSLKGKALRSLLFGAATAFACSASAGRPPDCWMTGGGSIYDTDEIVEYTGRTTHGMELHCDGRNPNNLQINWEGNSFHLTTLTSAICIDDDNINPLPRYAEFDTFIGIGEGRVNGVQGFQIFFEFTDAGEGGIADAARITILNVATGVEVLDIGATLTFGNHQAHTNG
jgi:hypothetical protein